MKIKLDENLPAGLLPVLSRLGHDADTVHSEGLTGQQDRQVWSATQEAARFFVTQDLDFSDIRNFRPGSHHGILLIRLRNPGRTALLEKLATLFQKEPSEQWAGCFVVVTDSKIRIHHPKQKK